MYHDNYDDCGITNSYHISIFGLKVSVCELSTFFIVEMTPPVPKPSTANRQELRTYIQECLNAKYCMYVNVYIETIF